MHSCIEEVDRYVNAQMAAIGIPGLSVGVAHHGHWVLRSYGRANVENRVPVINDTSYKLGSIGKQYIASAVMLLVEDGVVSLEDRYSEWVAEVPLAWSEITIRQLLSHTSGLQRDSSGFDPFVPRSPELMMASSYGEALVCSPGSEWSYSNLGYVCLAVLIERLTGVVYHVFVRERIFRAARLRATRICSVSDIISNRSSSYLSVNGVMVNAGDLLALRPSGAFMSDTADLLQWAEVLRTQEVLSAESRHAMETPVALDNGTSAPYGLGWEIASINGRRLIHHGGTLWCFRGEFLRFVDDGLTVVVLANHMSANARNIALRIAGLFDDRLATAVELVSCAEKCDVFELRRTE